jgi:hypothetical protein
MLEALAAHVTNRDVSPVPSKVFDARGEIIEAFRWLKS